MPSCLKTILTIVLSAIFWSSCGGTGTAPITPPPPATPIQVSVSPATANVAAMGTKEFVAQVSNSSDHTVSWQVNGITGGNAEVGTISETGLYTAPNHPASTTVTAVAHADSSKTGSGAVTVLAPHRIAVRTNAATLADLYDSESGLKFVARGSNYIRLGTMTRFDGSTMSGYHSTFNVGMYDAARAETALERMHDDGYNVVRVWVNGCCEGSIGNPAGGLNAAYAANLKDFLFRAKNNSVFVIITTDWPPDAGGYLDQYATCDSRLSGYNRVNLCAAGVASNVAFFRDLVTELVNQGAPLGAIFAYEIRNEYYYDGDQYPLNETAGSFTAANGQTYDLSDTSNRQKLIDDSLVYFVNQVTAAIKSVDPTALVTSGFFWPNTPNPTRWGDNRIINVYPAMANSNADFVDIHGYAIPGDLTVPQLMENYNVSGQDQKPVIFGEFGAFKSSYPLIQDAATVLENWQRATCSYNIQGWLLWTWDTEEPEQIPPLWSTMSGSGEIDNVLAPRYRPDPCQ